MSRRSATLRPIEAFLDLAGSCHGRSSRPARCCFRRDRGALFVLLEGALRIEKGGVPIASITEIGACVGEVSLLLDVPATADIVASEAGSRRGGGRREAACSPSIRSRARARAVARRTRVQHMTTYLADLQHQYADHEGGLGMVDVVLGSLMHSPGPRSEFRSERDPDPEY